MNYDGDNNPFADTAIRQATASTFTNQQTSSDYNPFANTTTPAKPAPPSQAAFLPPPQPPAPEQPPAYQPSAYTPVPTPVAVQQPANQYGSDAKTSSTRIDLSQYERQQAELEAREKRIAERERALANPATAGNRNNNFPPLPKFCPCRPCFYQDISIEIPSEFQLWVRYLYYLWLFYSLTLFLNMIGALSYFVTETGGGVHFGLSLVYLILFIPLSYICWFRPIYRAFRTDSSVYFMIYFVINIMFIAGTILFAIGFIDGMCGFVGLSVISHNKVVGLMMVVLGGLWSFISFAAIFLTIRVHQLYRQSGASLEQAQKEFQTAFVNNPTVRGAAREVATAGINEALRTDEDQRPIY